jgi:hypothetical protein
MDGIRANVDGRDVRFRHDQVGPRMMSHGDDDDFGAPDPGPAAEPPSNVIPFPALRESTKLADAWAKEVEAHNKKARKRHVMASPLDVVGSMIKMRGMPTLPWPAAWPQLGRRARTYVGECNAFVGSIGGGKTQWAIQMSLAVSGAGLPVLWGNLELGREQIIARILGNMHGEHAMNVLDNWPESKIRHQIKVVTDMWHFVDRYDDTDEQIDAFRDAIDVVQKIYRLPCMFVVDHMGQLIAESADRLEMLRVGKKFERLALDTKTWGLLLAQGTKSGQQLLTGRADVESAADAIGAAAESSIMQQVASNVIVSQLYKADDSMVLMGRNLLSKARWTGMEGQIGARFSKPGGVWTELDYLPATPTEVKAENEKAKKDKHRAGPAPTPAATRADLDSARAGNADAARRVWALDFLSSRGMMGATWQDMQSAPGVGRQHALAATMQELERSGQIEKTGDRWRIVPKKA